MQISMTSEFSKERQDAIFGHPNCKQLFEDKVSAIKVDATRMTEELIRAFTKVLPELTDHQLSLTDESYQHMVSLIQSPETLIVDGKYTVHSGVFMLMVNHLKQIAGKYYATDINERLAVRLAVTGVENSIMQQVHTIRTECIEEFYADADAKTLSEIDKMETQLKSSQMGPQTITNNGTN